MNVIKSAQTKLEWKDLRNLSLWERFIENNIQVPWAIISWILAANEYYLFPSVPTIKMNELVKRFDRIYPNSNKKNIF